MSQDNISTNCPRVSTESSSTKQRRKRKWDQPAEYLVSAGVAVPGVLPFGNVGITPTVVAPVSGASLTNPLTASPAALQQAFLVAPVQQHAAAIVQKLNQPKIQEELIAREIVINDAEPTVRYKLTKRQTQEEIQKCTGAVVITRGKYRSPNAPPDGEKPLYLHISAGAHLETTVERIKAVDRAAAMVEEILKQGYENNGVKVTHPLSTCVFLGFEADPSLNIASRIRGPNDQYVNHIMNETGAIVLLRGRDSGNSEFALGEEGLQPLHLFLSSNNAKSLEHAKLLAENLLDTICTECGASRVSSCKVYGAVPPPQQLLAGVLSSGNESKENAIPTVGLASPTVSFVPVPTVSAITVPQVPVAQAVGQPQPNLVSYPQPSLMGGTSYNGYGGIYPQATPLQQVALVLRQSTSPLTSTLSPSTAAASTSSTSSTSFSSEKEKRPQHKRKFQELPVDVKGPTKPHQNLLQVSEFHKPRAPTSDTISRNTSTMPAPRKLVQPSSNGMLPHPRSMPPPPPPPKFNSTSPRVHEYDNAQNKSKPETVPDTLFKLMEYGDDDDDEDEDQEETMEGPLKSTLNVSAAQKPFWAV